MVLADERQIDALINSVKKLPVDCKEFDDADSWVGIVLELESIRKNIFEPQPIKNPDDDKLPVPDPSEYIVEENTDG